MSRKRTNGHGIAYEATAQAITPELARLMLAAIDTAVASIGVCAGCRRPTTLCADCSRCEDCCEGHEV